MENKRLVCPECGNTDISANLLAHVTFTESGVMVDRSDVAFDKCAEATCETCDHTDLLYNFIEKAEESDSVSQKIVFTLNCDNAAFEDDLLGAVQAAFAEAAVMITKAIDCGRASQDGLAAFVRDINGNQCGRIDIVIE